MKEDGKTICPHCGELCFPRKKIRMDGWTPAGEEWVCNFCGKKLPEMESPAENKVSEAERKLSALLGETLPGKKQILSPEGKRFCKDCRFSVPHPFQLRCGKKDIPVDPMGDCDLFQQKNGNTGQ